jgi:CheY-like chemotaxis protein
MSRFQAYEGYTAGELAIFDQAFVDACRQLGLDPSPADDAIFRRLRDLATAIMNAARMGERDPATLSAIATSFGLRNWHLPKR